jgi:hypothetical protein
MRFTAALILILSSSAAYADLAARQLLELCNSGAPECHPIVQKHAVATLLAIKIAGVQGGQCLIDASKDITRAELEAVVLTYLRSHPEQSDDSLEILISRALASEYPCPD